MTIGVTSSRKILHECPLCGAAVELDQDDPLVAAMLSGDSGERGGGRTDRILSALCGCYVLRMDDSALGRLLASVLSMNGGPDKPSSD
ncbi:MAG TPA: hypothetical protein VFD74_04025 [Thermoleophilia bacterium]|nr:hypothetical protein [Thermoleophilia bacterium]